MPKRNRSRERARAAGIDTARGSDFGPPTSVTRISTSLEAEALAEWLLQPGRPWPVIVVSTAAGAPEPYVDVARLKLDIGDLAEVAVIPTGDVSWSFSSVMPSMTQVYGGASRVYAVDRDWVDDPHRSALRFAYSTADDERVRNKLVNDALESAIRAGLVGAGPAPGAVAATGVVRGVVGSRALVTLDDGREATVWEELTVPGVRLDRVLTPGMRVDGEYDAATRRLDLRAAIAEARPTSLAEIGAPGDLVLAEVTDVAVPEVTLRVAPELPVVVPRSRVTGNPLDDLSDLFSVGEIVLARVVTTDEGIGLRLDDIDDVAGVPNTAPSLLPGGPPWLRIPPPRRRGPGPAGDRAPRTTSAGPTVTPSRPIPVPSPGTVGPPARSGVLAPAGATPRPGPTPSALAPRSGPTPSALAPRPGPAAEPSVPVRVSAPTLLPGLPVEVSDSSPDAVPEQATQPEAADILAAPEAPGAPQVGRAADLAETAETAYALESTDDGSRGPTPRDLATRAPGAPAPPPPVRPAPADLAEAPASTGTAEPSSKGGALREATLHLAAERARSAAMERELALLRSVDRARAVELAELRRRSAELDAELLAAQRQIDEQKTRYRRADRARQLALKEVKSLKSAEESRSAERGEQAFADPVLQFQHEVYLEWARRIPASEKADKPLADFTLGAAFLDSLDTVEGVSRSKVVRVVVEVLTDEVWHIAGRDVHRLRRGPGGDDPYIEREDGAQSWRVALQRNTPGARRLHYWRLPGGGYELSRVVLHDDMEP